MAIEAGRPAHSPAGPLSVPPTLVRRDGMDAATALTWQRETARAVGAGVRMPTILIWRCGRALIATRPESRLPGLERARDVLGEAGWPVCVRDCGGSAFPVGPGSIQIALILPLRKGLSLPGLYARLTVPIIAALRQLGVPAGEAGIAGAFCAGSRDIAVGGRKLAGLAQAWRGLPGRDGYAMVTASVLIDGEPDSLCGTVNRFHRLAGSPLRCRGEAVTTVRCEAPSAAVASDLYVAFERAVGETLVTCIPALPDGISRGQWRLRQTTA